MGLFSRKRSRAAAEPEVVDDEVDGGGAEPDQDEVEVVEVVAEDAAPGRTDPGVGAAEVSADGAVGAPADGEGDLAEGSPADDGTTEPDDADDGAEGATAVGHGTTRDDDGDAAEASDSSARDEDSDTDDVDSDDGTATDEDSDDDDVDSDRITVDAEAGTASDSDDDDVDSDHVAVDAEAGTASDSDDDDSDEDVDSDDDEAGDEDDEDGDDTDDGVDTGQVEFELADWGARERQLIDSELAAARVRRAWEASTLVVAASDAEVVDDLIDYIEERIALDLSPDVEPVIYEVKDWPPSLEERFIDLLIENRIAHMRGYQEITVGIDDEERVDDLVEKVTSAWEDEQPTDAELDGPDAQEVLSELFVSSDRLLHDPSDRAATVRFDDAADAATTMGLPFGFDEATWGEITDLTQALRDQLTDADSSDDDIVEAATALRSHLRPLV